MSFTLELGYPKTQVVDNQRNIIVDITTIKSDNLSTMPTYVKVTQPIMVLGREIELECEFAFWGGDELEVSEGPFPVESEMPTLWRLEELVIENMDAMKVFDLTDVYEAAYEKAIDDAMDREPGIGSFSYD